MRRYNRNDSFIYRKHTERFTEDLFEFPKHAVDQSIIRRILAREIRETIVNGRIIKD